MFCDLQLDETRTVVTCKLCMHICQVSVEELQLIDYDLSRISIECRGGVIDESLIIHPSPPPKPPLYKRAWNFTRAFVIHLLKGNPRISKRKVDKRLLICKSCPSKLYFDGYCLHSSCGCPVHDRDTYLSKLYWRDGKCPLNYW